MSTISASKSKNLYVLTKDNFWWLTTLATNRKDCWDSVKQYATKEVLQTEGYKCVRVKLEIP